MNTLRHRLVLFLLLSFLIVPVVHLVGQVPPGAAVVDEEYSRYRKRGDDFFKEGKYIEARRQYQNCLEVPGFENDAYAKEQIIECITGLTLRQQVTDAVQQGKGRQAVDLLNQLLNLNPDDVITRAQIADYYERQGNQLFNEKRYPEARDNYVQALRYATVRQETLRLQIRTIDSQLKPSKQIGLKVLTGAVVVGSGALAYLLRHDYHTKLSALNQISNAADPSGTGIIANPDLYRQYTDAYNATQAAQKKNGLYNACIGVAAVAILAEAYLLLHKPTMRTHSLHWQPASQSVGLAISYTF